MSQCFRLERMNWGRIRNGVEVRTLTKVKPQLPDTAFEVSTCVLVVKSSDFIGPFAFCAVVCNYCASAEAISRGLFHGAGERPRPVP